MRHEGSRHQFEIFCDMAYIALHHPDPKYRNAMEDEFKTLADYLVRKNKLFVK